MLAVGIGTSISDKRRKKKVLGYGNQQNAILSFHFQLLLSKFTAAI